MINLNPTLTRTFTWLDLDVFDYFQQKLIRFIVFTVSLKYNYRKNTEINKKDYLLLNVVNNNLLPWLSAFGELKCCQMPVESSDGEICDKRQEKS